MPMWEKNEEAIKRRRNIVKRRIKELSETGEKKSFIYQTIANELRVATSTIYEDLKHLRKEEADALD